MTNTILERVSHDLHDALLVGLGYNQWISMYGYVWCVHVMYGFGKCMAFLRWISYLEVDSTGRRIDKEVDPMKR